MAYVTVAELKAYTGRYTDAEQDTLLQGFVTSAEETVQGYLGYSIADFSEINSIPVIYVQGDGSDTVQLPFAVSGVFNACEKPENVASSSTGESVPMVQAPVDWSSAQGVGLKDGLHIVENIAGGKFTRGVWYEITYVPAFWPSVPEKIRTVTLELATLYWEAAGGNLAVTSTSYADQGTRVFQNFTAEERYLKQLDQWRVNKAHVSRWKIS